MRQPGWRLPIILFPLYIATVQAGQPVSLPRKPPAELAPTSTLPIEQHLDTLPEKAYRDYVQTRLAALDQSEPQRSAELDCKQPGWQPLFADIATVLLVCDKLEALDPPPPPQPVSKTPSKAPGPELQRRYRMQYRLVNAGPLTLGNVRLSSWKNSVSVLSATPLTLPPGQWIKGDMVFRYEPWPNQPRLQIDSRSITVALPDPAAP
ncbi:hypothetical protein [Leeia aquatica]|uniref:Uncharacterized protein n=1 Tax=Leeia aquatica TaxID=2725557 RepID=A0A847S9T2_9NEIS|nr:hypothetical protein [Leeia aquatica]NLR75625.1 hypothetical protein [Leeia aquatica]